MARTRKQDGNTPNLWLPPTVEEELKQRGVELIAGVDEAGRGPLAGPVVAAAVILPPDARLPEVNDSKKLNAAHRARLFGEIHERALAVCVSVIGPETIDAINILQASRRAMREAVAGLPLMPQIALLDGLPVPDFPVEHLAIVGGDAGCLAIAAASIVAKVTRDRLMESLHEEIPHYDFARHKGYGTPDHLRRLREHGPCAAHRRSFAPVRACLAGGISETQCVEIPLPELDT
jgi:ribonuclease HII